MNTSSQSTAPEDRVFTLETLKEIPATPTPYAVLGHPVAHSLSPGFQNAAFSALGREARYVKIDVSPEELPEAVATMKNLGFGGWNITVPLKIEMFRLVDETGDQAKEFGAVNTVLHTDGKLIGFNTDGIGWANAIREDFQVDIPDMRIMILGAGGGAGRALAKFSALQQCERLVLVNRTTKKVKELAKELLPHWSSDRLIGPHERCIALGFDPDPLADELGACDLLVNATSVGLKPTEIQLIPARAIAPHLLVYDTIYRPPKTRLLQDAERRGARISNGLSMLLHSGAAAFSIWTGQAPPLEVMRERLWSDAASF